MKGLTAYTFHWCWDYAQHLILPYTLGIPLDIWVAWLNGGSTKDIWKIFVFYEPWVYFMGFVPSIIASYFNVEMEDGWGIMYN